MWSILNESSAPICPLRKSNCVNTQCVFWAKLKESSKGGRCGLALMTETYINHVFKGAQLNG